MNVFFTADLHLGHDNIRKHCGRPFDTVEEMDEAIISNWNRTVSARDLVYVVGDFAWSNHNLHLARLKGKKILIKGNHDKMSQDCPISTSSTSWWTKRENRKIFVFSTWRGKLSSSDLRIPYPAITFPGLRMRTSVAQFSATTPRTRS